MARQPLGGLGLVILRRFTIRLIDTPHSVGLLWTRDQLVAETSTWQNTTLKKDRHPCPRWDFFKFLLFMFQITTVSMYILLSIRLPFTIYTCCFSSSCTFWYSPFILHSAVCPFSPFAICVSFFHSLVMTAPMCDTFWVSLVIIPRRLVVHRLWRLTLVSVDP
jgi:hypothetical protein